LVTAAPADKSELIEVGVGLGIGEGVGVGVGVGLGVCACTEEDAAATATTRTKTMTMALASLRPVPVSLVRDSRDEQHMNAISKRSANATKMQKSQRPAPICAQFSGSVNRSWSPARGDYRTLLFPSHRRKGANRSPARFPEPRQKLANAQISCCNIRHNRI
jgi:hypothetical protein